MTLLKDEKIINTTELNKVVEQSRSEYEFDEAILRYIKSSPADFKMKWANHGFAATKVSVWEILLKNYFHSSVETTLSTLLQISNADIVNNVEATRKIYREVAQDLAGSGFTYGDNIHKSIQGSVRTAFMNNRQKYRKEFRALQNDDSINPTTTGESAEPLRRVTDGMAALRNIPAAEVKALLSDLYGTRFIYKFDTDTSTHIYYSMYESFLRVYFQHEMAEFNAMNKGQVQVTLTTHNEGKYKKLDEIMEAVFKDFVLPGISKENISEFQHAIFVIVKDKTVNNSVPVFGQKEITGIGETGNFDTKRTFASTNIAKEKFDDFIKGFIALSKLYHYLRDAGFTPYHIHADIFSFAFEDPSNKFLSLAEVVEFSSTYVQVRYKYDLKESWINFQALQSSNGTGSVLPRNYEDVILANRNNIVLENLTNSVINLTSDNPDSCYATIHMVDTEQKVNIFRLAELLSAEKNPLYAVFKGNGYEWDDTDTEEIVDPLALKDYFTQIMKSDASLYLDRDMTRASFLEFIPKTSGDLRDLFDDLTEFDLEVQLNILRALEDFVFEFKGFTDSFNAKYKGTTVSEVEYSTFLYKHPMFQELHDLIDPTAYRTKDDGLVGKVILVLLRKYYPELTLDGLKKFMNREVKNISYSNFIDSLGARTFKDITSYFHYAKANLFNLSDYGTPIRLSGTRLEHALQNASPVLELAQFQTRYEDIRSDRTGYLINAIGELYQIKTQNNKVGALHSSGLYIYTDGSTEAWSMKDRRTQ